VKLPAEQHHSSKVLSAQ